jgi:anti-sigma regulatory factor (Ser/Thr protein kinase)
LQATPEVPPRSEETAHRPDISERRTYRFPLPPHPIAAEQARALMRLALAQWDMNDIADDALIISAELVTNAVKIGEVFHLTLSCLDQAVLVEVWDNSEASPDRQSPSVDRVDGRGLLLVQACSKDWGWRLEDKGGKTVWAVVVGHDAEVDAHTITASAVRT